MLDGISRIWSPPPCRCKAFDAVPAERCAGRAYADAAGGGRGQIRHGGASEWDDLLESVPQMPPRLLQLTTIQDLLRWYELNLCNAHFTDRRGYRVRFLPENFVHLIQLKTKYGKEPGNKHKAVGEIRKNRIHFVRGRFDKQRAMELSWACSLATQPDRICHNWQVLGSGDEAYIKDFGTSKNHKYRVLICKVIGTVRYAWTIFPRERLGEKELRAQIWP